MQRTVFQTASAMTLACVIGLLAALAFAPPAAFAAPQTPTSFSPLGAGTIKTQAIDGATYENEEWAIYYESGKTSIVSYLGSGKDVTIPQSVEIDEVTYPVVGICENAFRDAAISSISIPSSITFIDDYAFAGCTSLARVTGCTGLTQIGDSAFSGCAKLGAFPFGKKLEYIGVQAFRGSKVTTARYPSYLADDGTGAYRPCTAMLYVKGKEDYKAAYKVLSKVNKERKKRGLPALAMDKDLLKAAMQRASETSIVFSHVRPNATMCFTASSKMSGENIAIGQRSAAAAMKSWMNSPGHKANILNKSFKSIGIGCFKINGRYCWTQAFGRDKAASASKPKNKTVTHAIVYNKQGGALKFKMKAKNVKRGKKTTAKIICTNSALRVTIQPQSFVFASSNAKVASVSSKGKIKGKKRGKAVIIARAKRGTLKVSKAVKIR